MMTEPGNPWNTGNGPSKMAEGIAVQRFAESRLPEDERICYDPYAKHFIDPVALGGWAAHPVEAKALADKWEQEMPGWGNAIRARVRYFDDVVTGAIGQELEQLVILGAGYDTRAYRIEGLKTLKVFEVDRPETLRVKTGIITRIFGSLPDHVIYVPADLGSEDPGQNLSVAGYSMERKTLFLLGGLVMYMPRWAVLDLLRFIRQHAGPGSSVLFDYLPEGAVDGTSDREGSGIIRDYTRSVGEPLLSGFCKGEAGAFLTRLGFAGVGVVTGEDFRRLYFHGKNAGRPVSGLMSLAYGYVPGPARAILPGGQS